MGLILFATASRPALGPTQPPIRRLRGLFPPGVKRPGREADHFPPFSAEVKNTWNYISTSPYAFKTVWKRYVFMAWCLVEHRDNFAFASFQICLKIWFKIIQIFQQPILSYRVRCTESGLLQVSRTVACVLLQRKIKHPQIQRFRSSQSVT
jgi:hypothetical protein